MNKDLFEILKLMQNNINKINNYEILGLEDLKGRILAQNIKALKNLPSFDNSALDGYAFKFKDKNNPIYIKGTIFAGDKNDYSINDNECYKIMTGAKMPLNSDTIIRLEEAEIKDKYLFINNDIKENDGHRKKGEELSIGDDLLQNGKVLNASDLMMVASQGIYKLKVLRKIKIAIFSSGDELVEPWQNADENSIYNANAIAIYNLLKNDLCDISYLGIIKDDLKLTKLAFDNNDFDLIISSGGASVGEADYMSKALKELDFVELFDHITTKPAKPTKLYKKNNQLVLILPGNPLSAFLSCLLIGKSIIKLLCGLDIDFKYEKAFFSGKLKIKNKRNNLILGQIKNNHFIVTNNNQNGSGMIRPLLQSSHLLISDFDQSEFNDMDEIKALKIDDI